jgi:hypothetical protein
VVSKSLSDSSTQTDSGVGDSSCICKSDVAAKPICDATVENSDKVDEGGGGGGAPEEEKGGVHGAAVHDAAAGGGGGGGSGASGSSGSSCASTQTVNRCVKVMIIHF